MLVTTFKVWVTCLILTVCFVVFSDAMRPRSKLKDIMYYIGGFLVIIDCVLLVILMLMGVWL